MLYYLDTVIVIYAVEGEPADQQRALNHLTLIQQAGHRFAISDLTRTECLVPLWRGRWAQASRFLPLLSRPELANGRLDGLHA